jgi:AbrB family looped-hinge helix DNA binding protein
MATSKVTSKFQVTIPKKIRRALGVSINDILNWTVREGFAQVAPAKPSFFKLRGSIHVGPGSTVEDVRKARTRRGGSDGPRKLRRR